MIGRGIMAVKNEYCPKTDQNVAILPLFDRLYFKHDVLKQTEFFSKVLITALNKFVPKKTLGVQPDTPAWSNTYTCLLLCKKNRNYCLFKKASCKLANAILNPLINDDYITILQTKKYKTQQYS